MDSDPSWSIPITHANLISPACSSLKQAVVLTLHWYPDRSADVSMGTTWILNLPSNFSSLAQFLLHLIEILFFGATLATSPTWIHLSQRISPPRMPMLCTWPRIAATDAAFQRGSWLAIDGVQGPGIALRRRDGMMTNRDSSYALRKSQIEKNIYEVKMDVYVAKQLSIWKFSIQIKTKHVA